MFYIASWAWYFPPRNLFKQFAYDCSIPKRAVNTCSITENVSSVVVVNAQGEG